MQVVSSTGSTTLTAAITSTTATAVSVASGQNLAAGVIIQVGTELMQVTAIAGLNLTVTRGFNGTTAATHTSGTTVTMMAAIAMGTLLNSTTAAAATSLAITGAQIRIDGTVYGSSSTVATTDAWGLAWLYTSLSAGPHRIEVQTPTTLPWTEPCFYVGPVGTIALQNAGLALQLYGNVVSGISGTQFTCNLPYPATSLTNLQGQILTFTGGALTGQSFVLAGAGHSGSNITLNVLYGWGTNPSAGDPFTLSNVATANSMTEGLEAIPGETQALVIDLSGENGGDGSAITTLNGQVLKTANVLTASQIQAADAAALTAAGLAPAGTLTVTSNTGSKTTFNASGVPALWTGPIIGLTGANTGAAGNITANLPGSGASYILTVAGLPYVPVSGDTFAAINLVTVQDMPNLIPPQINITDETDVDRDDPDNHRHHDCE